MHDVDEEMKDDQSIDMLPTEPSGLTTTWCAFFNDLIQSCSDGSKCHANPNKVSRWHKNDSAILQKRPNLHLTDICQRKCKDLTLNWIFLMNPLALYRSRKRGLDHLLLEERILLQRLIATVQRLWVIETLRTLFYMLTGFDQVVCKLLFEWFRVLFQCVVSSSLGMSGTGEKMQRIRRTRSVPPVSVARNAHVAKKNSEATMRRYRCMSGI